MAKRLYLPNFRAFALIFIALFVGLATGCSQEPRGPAGASFSTPLEKTLALASPTFQLRLPPGEHAHIVTRPMQDVTLAHCSTDMPLPQTFTLNPPNDLDIPLTEELAAFSPYRGLMAALVREAYVAAGYPPTEIQTTLTLTVPVGSQQRYLLGWQEVWDENLLAVTVDEQTIAEIPVRILLEAHPYAESKEATACSSALAEAITPTLAPTLETPPSASTPTPSSQATATSCSWPEARTPAEQVVAQYLRHLSQQEYEAAYALLSETYRLRLPYPRYAAGYAPVSAISLCALETRPADNAEGQIVLAHLLLTLETENRSFQDAWLAEYHVDGDAITNVVMYKASLAEKE